MSSPPTKSAPASCASRIFSPLAITSTRLDLPRPLGNTTVPRTIWLECFGSTPRLITNSTVSSNFAKWACFTVSAASPNSRRALEQFRCGGRLGDEGEAAIAENRNQHGDDHSLGLFVRLGIELLAKLHDVDPLRPQCGAHGRRGRSLGRRQLQLDHGFDFLGHL